MHELRLNTTDHSTRIRVGSGLAKELSGLEGDVVLLVDEEVLRLHSGLFSNQAHIALPRGENNKTLERMGELYRQLAEQGVDRDSLIIGIGGGLATDMAGFLASTYLRGLRFAFISTTLLGMVDASIGGKNGVNLDGYKNMVGCIRQPDFIWCDLDLLSTLPEREYRSGLSEVIKYGAIRDRSLLEYLERNMGSLLERSPEVLAEVVYRCAGMKAEIVEADEHEGGLRRILNFGHTLGHALERNSEYLHGEAIAAGMVMASQLSLNRGLVTREEHEFLRDLIHRAGLPVSLPCDAANLIANVGKDKKKAGEGLHFIFLEGLGATRIEKLAMEELEKDIHDLC